MVGFAHSGWGLAVKKEALPTDEMPPFDGIGANEYIVDVTHDLVDFISTVDTPYVWELNIWYHTLNVGYRARISGETDFPCIYGERVGLGRSYVRQTRKLDYRDWVEGIREGRNYVCDGKSHLHRFQGQRRRDGRRSSELKLDAPGTVHVTANVAALLEETPNEAIRKLPYDQKPYWDLERSRDRQLQKGAGGAGRQRPARSQAGDRRRRQDPADLLRRRNRSQQLGRAANPCRQSHQPDLRPGGRQADPLRA